MREGKDGHVAWSVEGRCERGLEACVEGGFGVGIKMIACVGVAWK
jgi:hypothetical protein